ncbi:type IIL restriction-modification enzyme MmeI [Curtobacterium flaccumfaciens]|uniref:type IIL restriction-modification enzyme MmeI n=1 Tax=Curtobacterium flaccumfaciens TaxID=2035 RepID=UPI003996278C
MSATERERIIAAGQAVLDARDSLAGQSSAQMYNPIAMDAELIKAHRQLDKIIDRFLGFAKVPSEQARAQRLFERYVQMTQQGQLAA